MPPLKWSTALANDARTWAKACTIDPKTGKFLHSSGPEGENLAWGPARTGKSAVDDWYSEKVHYDFTKPGFQGAAAHFTQVVWKTSTHLGCVVAPCKGQDFWVCRYSPPGNFANVNNVGPTYAANVPRVCVH